MDKSEEIKVSSHKLNSNSGFSNMLGLILAAVALIILLIALSIYRKTKVKKNGILLLGLCDSGKTLIFSRLLFKKFVQTHTSIKENVNEYVVGNASYKIIDIPGHERLRGRYFDQFKSLAKGLVYVVDSVTIQKDIKDVAEFLYSCLIDSSVTSSLPPLLILCNKQSDVTAKGSTVIKMMLEKEMNILRMTQTNQLQSIGKSGGNAFLGKEGRDFEFSHLHPMKVDFAECSALTNDNEKECNIEELEAWIERLI